MAFVVKREHFYPLSETYQGPTANIQLEFPFFFSPVPDQMTQLEALVKIALVANEIVPLVKDNYLSYHLAEEQRSSGLDRYRVTVVVAGETEPSSGSVGPFISGSSVPAGRMRYPGVRRLSRKQAGPRAFISVTLLVAIAIALGILLVFAAVAYNIWSGKWGPVAAAAFLVPIVAVVGGLVLVGYGLYGPKGRRELPQRG